MTFICDKCHEEEVFTCDKCHYQFTASLQVDIRAGFLRSGTHPYATLMAGRYCRYCVMSFIGASPNDFPLRR